MPTNYERLTVQEDDANAFTPTTSLLPLLIEEDDDSKRSGPSSRLRALGRIPRLMLYFFALVVGTTIMVFVLKLFLSTKTPVLRGAMTMDDAFDGSLSPRRHMIEWLPQCEFYLLTLEPECHISRGR